MQAGFEPANFWGRGGRYTVTATAETGERIEVWEVTNRLHVVFRVSIEYRITRLIKI